MRVRGKHEYDLPPEINSGDLIPGTKYTTVVPTQTDDESLGYYIGYQWVSSNTNSIWTCIDASIGAAVWESHGQTTALIVRNNSGATLTKGTLVMATGSLGASGKITVGKMIADGTIDAHLVLGVTAEDILNNAEGQVVDFGKIENLDTITAETWATGDVLWADPVVDGALTNVRPAAPNLKLPIAFVLYAHGVNGIIQVRIETGTDINSDHGSEISGEADGDLLVYVGVNSRWENLPQTNITQLGTITTGTWNGSAINQTYLVGQSGINTGDQTSIVGITGTKTQFDTALTDGNFMYIGDAPTSHTHLLAAGATDVTATAAELNLLDLSGLTAGWVLSADSATTASWKAPTAGSGDVATDIIWDAVGDLAVGTGANTAAKLIMGTSLQVLRVNAGATGLEWAAPSGGSARIQSAVSTTNATPTLLDAIDTLTDNSTHIIEVFITARATAANAEWGVWKRTLAVTRFSGTVVIRQVSSDMDKQSTNLRPNSVTFAVSGTSININVTGIAATNIDWDSTYEIITLS